MSQWSSTSRSEPILVPTLRSALSQLYSSSSSNITSRQAHSYLIEFQSRNTRRIILSLVQRENDSQVQQQQQEQARKNVLTNHAGSSMYASLFFLLSTPATSHDYQRHNEAEQLFCAQTVLHRLRRTKLSEAIDFEMEYNDGLSNPITLVDFVLQCNQYRVNEEESFVYWKEFISLHCQQLSMLFQHGNENNHGFVVLLNHVLQNYFDQNWRCKNSSDYYDCRWGYGSEIEERIKGELMMLVLGSIIYYNTYLNVLEKEFSKMQGQATNFMKNTGIGPLMHTLSSAMAVIAMRLRYTTSSVHNVNTLSISANDTIQSILSEQQQQLSQTNEPIGAGTANNIPIVRMMLQSIECISQAASLMSMQQIVPAIQQYESLHQLHSSITTEAIHKCIYTQLSTVPDALIGGNTSGGIRGRLSVDPKCIQYMNIELSTPETGIQIVMDSLHFILDQQQDQAIDVSRHHLFFLTCERWAKCVPLPKDFVERTITYSLNHILPNIDDESSESMQNAFSSYLINIFESACMTITQIASFNVGLSTDPNMSSHPPERKRQSSKSKKRQKEKFDSVTNHDHIVQAEKQKVHRGDIAFFAAYTSWEALYKMFQQNLQQSQDRNYVANGEGPIGCVCALVSACLPHIISNQNVGLEMSMVNLFVSNLMDSLKLICSHDNSSVRVLSFEHLPKIHAALVGKSSSTIVEYMLLTEIETCITKNMAECAILLAEQCAYPHDYFNDLTMDNDEDLEIERNDVRDIIRSLTSIDQKTLQVPLLILDYILLYCHETIMISVDSTNGEYNLPSEPAVHILSSPAKSLQYLAQNIHSLNKAKYLKTAQSIIRNALYSVIHSCDKVLVAFQLNVSLNQVFPISRLINICLASFSPFFSSMLANASNFDSNQLELLEGVLCRFVSINIESMKNIPELIAYSSLGNTVYDIRGAMRSPGGEDHVACIALMRLVVESNEVAFAALTAASKAKNNDIISIIVEISQVHDQLKSLEIKRGPGVFHGSGVTPKSRRVLLKSLCQLGLVASKAHQNTSDVISSEINRLFHGPLEKIIRENARTDIPKVSLIHSICEATHDLASFPPEFCSQLFYGGHDILQGTQLIINTVLSGYKDFHIYGDPSDTMIQWGRMRAALLELFRSCSHPNFSQLALYAIKSLIDEECNCILSHSLYGEQNFANSAIFHPSVISDEMVPAGIFLVAIRDAIIKTIRKANEIGSEEACTIISDCSSLLMECLQPVFRVLKSACDETKLSWDDPRSSIAEAWFLVMISLIDIHKSFEMKHGDQSTHLLTNSLGLFINLVMSTRVEKEYTENDQSDGLMSVDGPQSLAMVEFLQLVFTVKDISQTMLANIACLFQNDINLDYESIGSNNTSLIGGGLICASLFRAASGGLPPWTIEYIPDIFASFFGTCGGVSEFCLILQAGVDLRLSQTANVSFGVIRPGKKLAGYFLDQMKPRGRDEFLQKSYELCQKDSKDKWRNFKVLVKANCGGKKKASGFNLKPQPTSWDFERL